MSNSILQCPLCGFNYDPHAQTACSSCPVLPDCNVVCCPACGHSTIDVKRSRIAQTISSIQQKVNRSRDRDYRGRGKRFRGRFRRGRGHSRTRSPSPVQRRLTLADVFAGQTARLARFSEDIPPHRRHQLTAYGIRPGQWLNVVQHAAVTIVRLGHTELALERELASEIIVDQVKQGD